MPAHRDRVTLAHCNGMGYTTGMNSAAITPDSRGRILLTRLVDTYEEHYLARVNDNGVITLVPATLQPKMVTDALDVAPDLFEQLDDQFAKDSPATESDLWEQIKGDD